MDLNFQCLYFKIDVNNDSHRFVIIKLSNAEKNHKKLTQKVSATLIMGIQTLKNSDSLEVFDIMTIRCGIIRI